MTAARRCGCLDEHGRQLGTRCPKLATDAKHGHWAYRFSAGKKVDPSTGRLKRQQLSGSGYKTRKAALDAEARARAQLAGGTYVKPSHVMLGDYAVQWLARRQHTGSGLKPATVANYKRYITDDIVPSRIGAMRLADIRRPHVNQFAADLTAAGRGAVTVRRILTMLSTILATAARDELIPANPAVGADRPHVPGHAVKVWEPEAVRIFLQRCTGHRLGVIFEVAVLTGLRRGELTGLHWTDVDLVARKITVRRNRVSVKGKIIEQSTKTRAGLRTVPLSEMAVASLLAWQLRQGEESEAAGEHWHRTGYVFTNELGAPLDPAYVTRLFQAIRKQGQPLPELTFHGLRHCAASLMLASGADIAVVSKLMGHASIAITSDVYGHLVGTIAQQAVDGAANLIAHTVHTHGGVDTR